MSQPDRHAILDVLGAFYSVARPIIRRDYRADSCLGSTRVAMIALEHFGVPAKPLAVVVQLFNKAYRERAATLARYPESAEELEEWFAEHGAQVIGLGQPTDDATWCGHVVAVAAERYLVDASLDQATRQEHGIILPPVMVGRVDTSFSAKPSATSLATGATQVTYHSRPLDHAYVDAPDWSENRVAPRVALRVIAAMRKYLDSEPA